MKRFLLLLLSNALYLLSTQLRAQTPPGVVAAVHRAQRELHAVSYTLQRTDTLLSGAVRHMSGRVVVQVAPSDSLFGFYWWAQKDGEAQARLYTGSAGFELDTVQHTYRRVTRPAAIRQLVYSGGGGHLLLPDLVYLDTTNAVSCTLTQDAQYDYLLFRYKNLPQEGGVVNRYKQVTIDRATKLPVAVRQHQETLGQVQDLSYRVQQLRRDAQAERYAFAAPPFLASYRPQLGAAVAAAAPSPLLGHAAPDFHLAALSGSEISLAALRGQVVLLDFWEVWCGPCVASLPKLQRLHEQYAAKGLRVVGIAHEPNQIAAIQRLLAAEQVTFPTLLGTAATKHAYQLAAVPRYVVVNRQGTICFVEDGFSAALETAIRQALQP